MDKIISIWARKQNAIRIIWKKLGSHKDYFLNLSCCKFKMKTHTSEREASSFPQSKTLQTSLSAQIKLWELVWAGWTGIDTFKIKRNTNSQRVLWAPLLDLHPSGINTTGCMKLTDVTFQDFCVYKCKRHNLNFPVSLRILTPQLNIFACQTQFVSRRAASNWKTVFTALFPLWILKVFSVCMNAFMIQGDRGQYSWRFQVYVALFSQKGWRRKPDPPLLQAACGKIWNLRNLFLQLSSKVCEINPLGNADALNRLLLSFWIVHIFSLLSLSLE